ncbi:hypothetical protein [Streptomyces bottropensis]|uniref:hypothetical protein n=1 Tax=Streptomyces bottropensis TaxID=42235 RepID=UPI0036950BA2
MLTHLEGQESEIAAQAEATRGRIAELTAQLEEFDRVAEGVRITRKTLLALPDPTPPAAKLPDHPAYRQIMAMFAAADTPLRARAFCEAMDLCTRRRCGALGQRCVKRMTPLPAMSRSGSSVALGRRCGEVVLAVVGRLGVAPAVPVCRWRPEKDWIGST